MIRPSAWPGVFLLLVILSAGAWLLTWSELATEREAREAVTAGRDNLQIELERLQNSLHASRTLVRAVDGDTVELDGKERVRLLNVSAPETWRKNEKGGWERIPDPDPRGVAAYEFLRSYEGARVRVTLDAERKDRYGRTLAHLYAVGDGVDLGAELIRRGWAKPNAIGKSTRRYGDYKAAAAVPSSPQPVAAAAEAP